MDFHSFLLSEFDSLEEWSPALQDFSYGLLNRKDVVITKNILSFLFKNKYNLDKEYELGAAINKFVSILKEHDIHYMEVKVTPKLNREYPDGCSYLDDEIWIMLHPNNFKIALMYVDKEASKSYFLLEEYVNDYRDYMVEEYRKKLKGHIIKIIDNLKLEK